MRLTPLPDEDWTDRTRTALGVLLPPHWRNAKDAGNALATLAHHPDLAEAFLTFSGYLMLRSSVPARLREMAILRMAHRRDCQYEVVHHAAAAAKAGMSEDEIDAAMRGKADDKLESAILSAVDELDGDSTISEATWATLSEHLDERQRMDLVFIIGAYCLMAMAFNTFGVQPE